jgi:hypothetical protein
MSARWPLTSADQQKTGVRASPNFLFILPPPTKFHRGQTPILFLPGYFRPNFIGVRPQFYSLRPNLIGVRPQYYSYPTTFDQILLGSDPNFIRSNLILTLLYPVFVPPPRCYSESASGAQCGHDTSYTYCGDSCWRGVTTARQAKHWTVTVGSSFGLRAVR